MPGIETSSDVYQNRNQGLTTYRKNVQGPALRDEMARRTEDRAKAAQVNARQVPASAMPKDRPPMAGAPAARTAATPIAGGATAPHGSAALAASPSGAAAAPATRGAAAVAVTPARVVHELYAPAARNTREHDDRHSMITGGTVDVRA